MYLGANKKEWERGERRGMYRIKETELALKVYSFCL